MYIAKKIFDLLNQEQKKTSFILLFFMIIGMFLEVFSIGLIIPLLATLTESDFSQNIFFDYLSRAQILLELNSIFHLIVFLLLFVYSIKITFLVFLSWFQANFVWNLQANISSRLFENYIRQDYSFFFKRNSSELLRNTMGEAGQYSGSVMSLANLISEVLVILGISIMLILYQPKLAFISIILLSLSSILFYLLIRNKIKVWGKTRQIHEALRYKNFQESIGALKDIKLMGRENYMINLYSHNTYTSTHASKFNSMLQSVPRLWLEFFVVIIISLFLLIFNNSEDNFNSFVPVIGVMAAAAFRLMPSINRIMYSLQNLRFADAVIFNLDKELNLKYETSKNESYNNLKFTKSIKVKNITYNYPSSNYNAISSINLEINKGDKIGIMGPTGSGKSTLLDILLAFIEPTSGEILIDDVPLNRENRRSWQNLIGYVSQNIFLADDTLEKNIALGLNVDQINSKNIQESINKSQLQSFVNDLPEGIKTNVGESGIKLSGGQKQRIAIARSLYHKPEIIIFDEASSALDTKTEDDLFHAINSLSDKTIIIVTHRASSLKNCNLIINIRNGRIENIKK